MKKIIFEKKIKFDKNLPKEFKSFIYEVLKFSAKDRPTCKDILKHEIF